MSSFRFIHAADIHLDSPLIGLAGQEGSAANRIRAATRESFDALIELALNEEVDFLVIAGDLYDGDWRDFKTGLFFARQMGRLAEARIPVFLLHGNHDAQSQITRRLSLPGNVTTFPARRPETFRLDKLGVALHGQSYRQRDMPDNMSAAYPPPVAGMFNIGVLHTGLGGMAGHANYAPCTLTDLTGKGYDYWALGHVHQGAVLNETPHVVFPGNLQGRHIRETGPKGAVLVTVRGGEVRALSPLITDTVRWAFVPVSVSGCVQVVDCIDRIREALEKAVATLADGRLLACRIELTGRCEAHDGLLASSNMLLAEARAATLALGEEAAWVERVIVATTPAIDPEILRARNEALGDLQSMLTEAGNDPVFLDSLVTEIGDFLRKLPHELRAEPDDALLKAALAGDHLAVADIASRYLMARLTMGEE